MIFDMIHDFLNSRFRQFESGV